MGALRGVTHGIISHPSLEQDLAELTITLCPPLCFSSKVSFSLKWKTSSARRCSLLQVCWLMSWKLISLSRIPTQVQATALGQTLGTALQLPDLSQYTLCQQNYQEKASGVGGPGSTCPNDAQGRICLAPMTMRTFATNGGCQVPGGEGTACHKVKQSQLCAWSLHWV